MIEREGLRVSKRVYERTRATIRLKETGLSYLMSEISVDNEVKNLRHIELFQFTKSENEILIKYHNCTLSDHNNNNNNNSKGGKEGMWC